MRRREGTGYVNVEWSAGLTEIDGRLRSVGRLGAMLSPHLTVEEAYLLAKYVRSIDPEALIALGPVPIVGQVMPPANKSWTPAPAVPLPVGVRRGPPVEMVEGGARREAAQIALGPVGR